MDEMNKDFPAGLWSKIEFLALLVVVKVQAETKQIVSINDNPQYIFVLYNLLVHHVRKTSKNNIMPLRNKTERQIEAKLKHLNAS